MSLSPFPSSDNSTFEAEFAKNSSQVRHRVHFLHSGLSQLVRRSSFGYYFSLLHLAMPLSLLQIAPKRGQHKHPHLFAALSYTLQFSPCTLIIWAPRITNILECAWFNWILSDETVFVFLSTSSLRVILCDTCFKPRGRRSFDGLEHRSPLIFSFLQRSINRKNFMNEELRKEIEN